MTNEDENFLLMQELDGVTPLQVEKRIVIKRDSASELAKKARRQAAAQDLSKDNNHLASDHVELLNAHYALEFKRAGVQNGVFKKLKQGRYRSEARLDLHRLVVEKARVEVYDFIKECAAYDLRSLIIIHGKGQHSNSNAALLKSYVNKWLPEMQEVQAFCSAQPQHGGMGAVYVLLAKSENKKQENRERISRGRGIGG